MGLCLHVPYGESIFISDDIEVMVLPNRSSNSVTLNVIAPKNIPVHRRIVKERIEAGIPHPKDRV